MKYVQILANTLVFITSAALLVQMRAQDRIWTYVILFLLCGANLLSRFTEMSVNDQIADAEEKVAKRVLRRLAKVMPELLNEYFKAQAPKPAEKLSDVITVGTEPGVGYGYPQFIQRTTLTRPIETQPETLREGSDKPTS